MGSQKSDGGVMKCDLEPKTMSNSTFYSLLPEYKQNEVKENVRSILHISLLNIDLVNTAM